MAGNGKRVVVAMSGGVDSSVAAALLAEEGYEVVGVMMRLWAPGRPEENRCCSPQAVADARRVCQMVGARFYLLNFEEPFRQQVVDYFRDGYLAGRTPNPCLMCNRHLKFGMLLNQALALGADYLATGHYARVDKQNGSYRLLKAKDPAKDQSYALYMLGQRELAHVLFPNGEFTKQEVRGLAQRFGLPVAEKEESMELCFIPQGDYRQFLEAEGVALPPGPILDEGGRVLGQHQGITNYTIGQRRGLGLNGSQPLYVLAIDKERNALIVGSEEKLGQREVWAREMSYPVGHPPAAGLEVTAKVRYRAQESPAIIQPLGDGRARLLFSQPQRAVAPGQGVVLYRGEELIGGGIIEAAA
ncbi:MAG: tRNA 2-thiouridine(34) synthase MnmA [Chloroflexi bacterium]|nr:tRNA 2-thiouridine(34) synthase MnmA [Chloroflexota bacterium]